MFCLSSANHHYWKWTDLDEGCSQRPVMRRAKCLTDTGPVWKIQQRELWMSSVLSGFYVVFSFHRFGTFVACGVATERMFLAQLGAVQDSLTSAATAREQSKNWKAIFRIIKKHHNKRAIVRIIVNESCRGLSSSREKWLDVTKQDTFPSDTCVPATLHKRKV